MQINQSLFVVDAHTTGTPIRVITGGIPTLRGANITAKMEYMKQNYDWLRSCSMQQPRGFQSLVGAVLTEPCVPKADFGLFYIDSLGYQPMCGAGTLAVAKVVMAINPCVAQVLLPWLRWWRKPVWLILLSQTPKWFLKHRLA